MIGLASHTPFFPFSDLQNDDDEIKIEVELNPDHFQYDAITTDGLEERNQLANTVPETRDTNLDFNPHSYNPSNFVPQSGTEHCNTEHSDLHNSNQDNPEESSNIPVKVADEKDCVHQRLDNADSNGQPNFEKDHLNSLGNDVDATIPESWTEDTCTLGRHFMSFHQSSDRTDDGEDTTETNCKLNNMDSDNQSCSSESDSDSDYRPSTSRAIRTKPKKKISLAKKLSTAMNNSVKDRKCPHCNFYISKRVDFHRHVELHRGEKDFPCKQCPARELTTKSASQNGLTMVPVPDTITVRD
ncbi:unnamed protein product [Allacma fusca]|uniref:C2H2-type domain-containing protein n=1 Tax=Allacma fusca TaxID=39272 RepID=A0A8J2J766_9HEXA|nr:unnamed protein product [Allacma fusca]